MEIESRTLKLCTLPRFLTDSATVDAALSPPPELPDIARVLYAAGRARLFGAEAAHGCILCDGNVVYTVCYLSAEGAVEAWSSAAAFRCTLTAAEVAPGSVVTAEARVAETTFKQGGPRDVYLRSEIELRAAVVANEQVSCISGDGLIARTQKYTVGGVKEHKSAKLTVTETVRPDVPAVSVIMAAGYAVTEAAVPDGDAVAVQGSVHICCTLKTQGSQPVLTRTYRLPFAQLLAFDGLELEDMARVHAAADEVTAALSEDGSIAITAVVTVRAVVSGRREIKAVCDAYSTERSLEVTRLEVTAASDAWAACQSASVQLHTDMSGSGDVTVLAEPAIVWSRAGTDEIEAEGILDVRAIFEHNGELACRTAELPFTATLEAAGVRPDSQVMLSCHCRSVAGELASGRLNVTAELDFPMQIFSRCDLRLVTAAEDTGPLEKKRGLYVCFAREGETLFDIARRYATTQEKIARLNPDAGTELAAGQKLIIHT